MPTPRLDIVIPVYHEGRNIAAVLDALFRDVQTPCRVLICYDRDDDDTLPVVRQDPDAARRLVLVKSEGLGPHAAVRSGFRASTAPAVLVFPSDDTYNAGMIDGMVAAFEHGADLVAASRFMKGGCMVGCPWLKAVLVRVAAVTLRVLAGIPTHDATNGLRLFSRRLVDGVELESRRGFAFSLELLVKCHRLGWPVREVPAQWFERSGRASRFRLFRWLPDYLRWYGYAFATRYLNRPAETVRLTERRGMAAGTASGSAMTTAGGGARSW